MYKCRRGPGLASPAPGPVCMYVLMDDHYGVTSYLGSELTTYMRWEDIVGYHIIGARQHVTRYVPKVPCRMVA